MCFDEYRILTPYYMFIIIFSFLHPIYNSEYITQITNSYSEVTRIVDELPQTIFN